MRFSRKFKSSSHCLPSPDGRFVATVLPSGIHVRGVDHLDEVVHVVALPADLSAGAVVSFQWSSSSQHVLLATSDQVLVAAALPSEDEREGVQPFRAVIRNPTLPIVARPAFVGFGAAGNRVCLCSAFGIKFAIFDLQTGKTVEISNPKLFSPASVCSRGFSFRSTSHHLALLTRTAGKDWVSVHDPASAAPVASWAPDTIDAQGLIWSPDGRWLVVWESPAHGNKIAFFTPDGHHFKTWTGSDNSAPGRAKVEGGRQDTPTSHAEAPAVDESLGSGVRLIQFSSDARILAVGDGSRRVRIIDMSSITETKWLLHPTTLTPQGHASITIWQEQIDQPNPEATVDAYHRFIEAAQDVSPPGRSAPASSDSTTVSSGCSLLVFDSSSTLLATRLEEAPSTVWVWNLETSQLCAVLMLHANVSTVVWHPTAPQTLLITCDGDKHRGLGLVWSPLHGPPQAADFSQYYPLTSNESQSTSAFPVSKYRPTWLNFDGLPPSLFYSDGNEFALAALDEDSHYKGMHSPPWSDAAPPSATSFLGGQRWAAEDQVREESPLELVPAGVGVEGDSELEDTFYYKKEE